MATPIIGDFTIFAKTATVRYTDSAATRLFDLPAHAHIVDIKVDVVETFDGGTQTIDIGEYGETNRFVDGADVSGAAGSRATVACLDCGVDLGERLTEVQALTVGTSTGIAAVTILYFCFDRSHLH